MVRQNYPNPPIVEAIIELRFAETVTREALLSAMQQRHAEKYSGKRQKQEIIQISAAINPDDIATETTRKPHVEMLSSPNGRRLIACGDGVLSVHVLAPYPGWENFVDHLIEATSALPMEIRQQPLQSVAVRYIDRIVLPAPVVDLDDFFTILPRLPKDGPQSIALLNVVAHRLNPTQDVETLLILKTDTPESDGRPTILFDFLARRKSMDGCSLGADGRWMPFVEALHELQRESFESSITELCRETFR